MDETWQRDSEQAADHHIRTHLEHDRRQLARRLHEDALGMRCPGPTGQQADPIRRCLADVMISGTQYLAQLMTSSVARSEDLADDLLRLHHQLRPSDVRQQMDAAAWAECELPQEPVPAGHGGISTRAADLASRIQAEGPKSHAKHLLQRLRSWIAGMRDPFDEHEQLRAVCSELLLLCEHLGITKAAEQPGGAR